MEQGIEIQNPDKILSQLKGEKEDSQSLKGYEYLISIYPSWIEAIASAMEACENICQSEGLMDVFEGLCQYAETFLSSLKAKLDKFSASSPEWQKTAFLNEKSFSKKFEELIYDLKHPRSVQNRLQNIERHELTTGQFQCRVREEILKKFGKKF